MSLATTVATMVTAGCSPAQIAAVVEAHEREQEAAAEAKRASRREGNAERQRRWRNAHNAVMQPVTRDSPAPSPEKEKVSPTPPLKEKLTPSPPPEKLRARGHRLPAGWKPSDADRQFALDRLGSNRACHEALAAFCDFWWSKAGADACKLDWSMTWRNWVRRAAEHKPRGLPHARAGPERGNSYLQALLDITDPDHGSPNPDDDALLELPAS